MAADLIKKIKKYFLEINIKIFALSGGAVIILIIFIFIYPASGRMSVISQKAKELKINILAQKAGASLKLKDVGNSYDKYEPKLRLMNQAIIAKDRELEFITSLENIAALYNLRQKINIGEMEEIKNTAGYGKIPLTISLQGEFKNEIKYLQSIEKLPNYVDIKKISINSALAENNATTTNMLLLTDTFWK